MLHEVVEDLVVVDKVEDLVLLQVKLLKPTQVVVEDLALLVVDAAAISATTATTVPQGKGRTALVALIFGMMACFGVGATAGAQLAGGLVGGSGKSNPHQIDVRPIGDSLSLSFDAARKRK